MIRSPIRLLGSTDAAVVAAHYDPGLGLSLPKSKTIGDVFARLAWGIEQKSNNRMRRGNEFEPLALETYANHVGPTWRPELADGEWWAVRHPKYEWATTSPDAFDAEPPNHRVLVEAKTASIWSRSQWGDPGSDRMATRFLFQLAWSMACCEVDTAHLVVLFGTDATDEYGNPDFAVTETAVYFSNRDAQLEEMLFGYGQRFIDEFVARGMPPPTKPATNRRAWQRKVAELGLSPRSDYWIDLNRKHREGAGEVSEGDAAGVEEQGE